MNFTLSLRAGDRELEGPEPLVVGGVDVHLDPVGAGVGDLPG